MNVVLEQIKRKYEIPKDVLHYIIEFFRPRAPRGVLMWNKWENIGSNGLKRWYRWGILTEDILYFHVYDEICYACVYCLKINTRVFRCCYRCKNALAVINTAYLAYN